MIAIRVLVSRIDPALILFLPSNIARRQVASGLSQVILVCDKLIVLILSVHDCDQSAASRIDPALILFLPYNIACRQVQSEN